jgi:hypothetical protein
MSVLRKKIDTNSGLPPSILQVRAFWDLISNVSSAWANDATGLEAICDISDRKVLSACKASDLLGENVFFLFASGTETGPSAIILDQACVAQCAAYRFSEEVETISAASKIFLKLACEAAALNLANAICLKVLMQSEPLKLGMPIGFHSAENRFGGDGEYLHVVIKISLAAVPASIGLLFPIGAIHTAVQKRWQALTEARDGNGEHSHDILRKSVRASSLTINAVLDQFMMTVGECSRLNVGQILPLKNADSSNLRLSTETLTGPLNITHGEMGVWKDCRAVKLAGPVSDGFLRNVADL